jgi:hypothetical protein
MKKFTILFLILVLHSSLKLKAQEPPAPVLGSGESWTNLYSQSYDYQTNGSVRYIVQDPSNPNSLCSILMAQQDSNTAVGVNRYVYYSYSEDNGATWTPSVLDNTGNWGFPDMSLSGGLPIISQHRFGVLANVFKDVIFGGFSFSVLTGQATNIIPSWPHLSGTSNGNVVMAASTNDGAAYGGFFSTYNGSTWSQWTSMPLVGGPSGNYSVESGTNGVVGIFGTNYAGDGALYYYKSTDNGLTFDNGTQIFNYLLDGPDTLFANITGGLQAVYTGEEAHVTFTVYNVSANVFPNPNTVQYIKPKIMHWSPSTGLTQVAGRFNIPNLTDTITTILLVPVGQPSVSRTPEGKLICSYTTFLRGNTQVVDNGDLLNAGEIFANYSNDNGVTWTTPVNLTNTPGIEEKHSSLINKATTDSIKIYYLRDMKAGGWVNVPAWGKAPVYGIYKKGAWTVGINQINTIADTYQLSQNYPNPFNPSTSIKFSLKKSAFTTLIIYNTLGKEITRLVNENLNSGNYEYEFAADKFGLTSGAYFYRLTSGDFSEVKQMILVK